jgi:RimJ/RimL family protein N-acetyltransferase
MIYTEHQHAGTFLAVARPALERDEAANGLMLGVCLRLVGEPHAYGSSRPYLATVESASGLRVAAVMTPPYRLQLYAQEDDDVAGLELLAEGLLRGAWRVPGVIARDTVAEAFASVWSRKTGVQWRTGMRQGVHELRKVEHPAYPAGEFGPAAAADVALVRRWARGFHEACFGDDRWERSVKEAEARLNSGALFLWVDGEPVSMAARSRPTPHGEAISFVYTPPDLRGRGYATALVARLSQRILDEGKQFCTLYTDLGNPTSNRIYRSIGYRKVAEVVDVEFQGKADTDQTRPAP